MHQYVIANKSDRDVCVIGPHGDPIKLRPGALYCWGAELSSEVYRAVCSNDLCVLVCPNDEKKVAWRNEGF